MIQSDTAYRRRLLEEIERIPVEYRPFLLDMVRAFRESVTLETAEESFRQGWQEALRGETQPAADLWGQLTKIAPRRPADSHPEPFRSASR